MYLLFYKKEAYLLSPQHISFFYLFYSSSFFISLSFHFLLWFLDVKGICEHVLVSWQDIYFFFFFLVYAELLYFFFLFKFIHFNYRLIALQYCMGFAIHCISTLFIFIFLILVSFSCCSGKVCYHFPPPTLIFPCNITFLSLQLKTWFLWQLSIMVPCNQPNVSAWLTSGQS